MRVSRFSDRKLKSLNPDPKKDRIEVFEASGLGIRIYQSGRKTWFAIYRHHGRQRRITYGEYPAIPLAEAREKHAKAMNRNKRGKDPAAELMAQRREERAAETVEELIADFLKRYPFKRPRTKAEYKRVLEGEVRKRWGKTKAKEIRRRDVIALLDAIEGRDAGTMANRTLAYVRKLFNWAVSRDLLEHSPCTQVPAPAIESPRRRYLSDKELAAFVTGLRTIDAKKLSHSIRLAMWLLLVTGQRPGEVAGARWDEIDDAWWELPGNRTKNHQDHRVPLSPLALRVLEESRSRLGDPVFVFPSLRVSRRPIPPTSINQAIQDNREDWGIAHFRAHDIRRTVQTGLTSMGFSRFLAGRILNHAEGKRNVGAVYDRYTYDREKREAVEAWAKKVEGIKAEEVAA